MDIVSSWLLDTATSPWAILAILLCCTLDGFFPVVPSETLVVAVASVSWTTGSPALILVMAAATAGAWAGDTITYAIGRRLSISGSMLERRPRLARITERAMASLRRRPAVTLVTGRFIPVARIGITLAAGATLPYRRYFPISVISALTWTTYTVTMAIVAGAFLSDYPLVAAGTAVTLACVTGLAIERIMSARERASQGVTR